MDPKYEAIIELPHYVSSMHPHMSLHDRAAQFAPFATLSGHAETINEQHRYVEQRPPMFDYELDEPNRQVTVIMQRPYEAPEITVRYFVKDKKKSGGICKEEKIQVHRINLTKKCVESVDGRIYKFFDILRIDGIQVSGVL